MNLYLYNKKRREDWAWDYWSSPIYLLVHFHFPILLAPLCSSMFVSDHWMNSLSIEKNNKIVKKTKKVTFIHLWKKHLNNIEFYVYLILFYFYFNSLTNSFIFFISGFEKDDMYKLDASSRKRLIATCRQWSFALLYLNRTNCNIYYTYIIISQYKAIRNN